MPTTHTPDPEIRAGLLCYLLVVQQLAHARTGGWIQTRELVKSAGLWVCANAAQCDRSDQVRLARVSIELAPHVYGQAFPKDEASLARLFIDNSRLDYRSAVVLDIHDLCATHLAIP